jgi:hypothetical protein
MISRLRIGVVLLLAVLVGACAGRDFTRATPDSLQLGKTTYAEIVGRFGTPYREGTTLKNNHTVKVISYAYSVSGGTPLTSGVTPARSQAFYFADLVLVGHEFSSSFKDDHSDFPEARVTEIKKGETTESAVVEMLGPPTGLWTFPLVGKDEKGLVYSYSQTRVEPIPFAPKIKHYQKEVVVSVNGSGTVTGVQFNASGEK